MIKSADIFLRKEGQQLDFSSSNLDILDFFNNSANTVNKLLIDTGAEDPILEDIKGNAAESNENFEMFNQQTNDSTNIFGFEDQPVREPVRNSAPIREPIREPVREPVKVDNGFSISSNDGNNGVVAQVTRYGFENDKYQSKRATTKGSKYENIGNRDNILKDGVSVALPPRTAKALGINSKAGDFVEANIGGKWQRFRVDDTTADHKNHRIDFFDPKGKRVKIDGSKVKLRKLR